MREKLKHFFSSWREVPTLYPAETGLSILFIISFIIDFETENSMTQCILYYAPLLFFLTFALNGWSSGEKWNHWKHMVYLLSGITFVPLVLLNSNFKWTSYSTTYAVTLLILLLLCLINNRPEENRTFIQKSYRLAGSALSAFVLSGIAYLLVLSIYEAIWTLFDLQDYAFDRSSRRVEAYAGAFIFCGLMIGLFLFFNRKEKLFAKGGKVLEILFRFILTPALLIYTAIFYMYILRIVFTWSLPNGNICYMAAAFIFSSYLLKGIRMLLKGAHYKQYFHYISWINLPTLVLYWVSASYRIHEYGWTEMRVYLVAAGVVMTALVLLFLQHKGKEYLKCSWFAIFVLAVVTYIPGITARDIERISQTGRDNYPIKEEKRESVNIRLYEYSNELSIEGYRSFSVLYPKYTDQREDFITYGSKDSTTFKLSKKEFLKGQLEKNGLTEHDKIPEKIYPSLLRWETDSTLVVFDNIELSWVADDKDYEISFYGEAFYFRK